jgi:hypothetical protein
MKTFFKILLIGFLIAGCISLYFYDWIKYSYHVDTKNYTQHFWIFTDSAKKDIPVQFYSRYRRKTDILNAFPYKDHCQILVWEFKNLKKTKLKDITFRSNINLGDIKFKSYEILFKDSYPEIWVNFGSFFTSTLNPNFDQYSKINKHFEGKNYVGVSGMLHKMSLSDINGKNWVTIDSYDQTWNFTAFFYRGQDSLFLILVISKGPISDDIVNIFNLK